MSTSLKNQRRPGQHEDESTADYLRRVVQNIDHENESLLYDLPSVGAVLEFFELWHVYGTDFWSGVLEGIAEGEDPAPARAFVRRHKLPRPWRDAISEAVKLAKEGRK